MNKSISNLIILTLFIFVSLLSGCATERTFMPQVAGQDVPRANFTIDFEKRYNIVCSQYQGPSLSFENVKIIGYTGTEVRESSGTISKSYSHFNHWLVVERVDGRKVYIPMSSISVLEEPERETK